MSGYKMGGFNSLRDVEEKFHAGIYELVRRREKYPPPSGKKILHYLATHRWGKRMEIRGATGLSYSRVYRNLELLEEDGLVESEQVDTSKRGDPVKAYSLTTLGFHRLFLVQPGFWRKEKLEPPLTDMDEIIGGYKDLFPGPIVNNWNLIKEKGLADLLRECLNMPDALARTKFFNALALLPLSYQDFSTPPEDRTGKYKKWMELIRENSELREWVLKILEAEQGHRAERLENVKKAIKEVQALEESRRTSPPVSP